MKLNVFENINSWTDIEELDERAKPQRLDLSTDQLEARGTHFTVREKGKDAVERFIKNYKSARPKPFPVQRV